jgi:uncharacterized membrane protein
MDVVWKCALLWALFAGTHVGLATSPVRGPLVRALGERGFLAIFFGVASVLFPVLAAYYADHHAEGPPGPALGQVSWLRPVLVSAIVAGMMLMAGAFAPKGYWSSPLLPLSRRVRGPVGLERITLHPFFSGTVLVFGAHALLSERLIGTVFSAGFVTLAVLGPLHQAHKLRAKKGATFGTYLSETSAVPFLAILQGRQQLVLHELPWGFLALGALLAWLVARGHEHILAWHGAPLSLGVVGGSWLIALIIALKGTRPR